MREHATGCRFFYRYSCAGNAAVRPHTEHSCVNISAAFIVPHEAPSAKVAATHGYGGEILFYDRFKDNREKISQDFVEKRRMTLIPPFHHPDIIASKYRGAL
jgi:threonine dehydratase